MGVAASTWAARSKTVAYGASFSAVRITLSRRQKNEDKTRWHVMPRTADAVGSFFGDGATPEAAARVQEAP